MAELRRISWLSPMSRTIAALLASAALLAPAASFAQDKPITVFFQPCDVQFLNDAITAALSQPPFLLATRITPGALVVSVPDKVEVERNQVSGKSWTFNAVFSRDGDPLGHSLESCNQAKLSDCTDQLLADIRTAAGAL
jgi:hypothetical protein